MTTIDMDGWCLALLFVMVGFLIGSVTGVCIVKRDEKTDRYLAEAFQNKENVIKEVKEKLKKMSIEEFYSWLENL